MDSERYISNRYSLALKRFGSGLVTLAGLIVLSSSSQVYAFFIYNDAFPFWHHPLFSLSSIHGPNRRRS